MPGGNQWECTGQLSWFWKCQKMRLDSQNASYQVLLGLPYRPKILKFSAVDAKVAPRAFARSKSNARRSLVKKRRHFAPTFRKVDWPAKLLNLQIFFTLRLRLFNSAPLYDAKVAQVWFKLQWPPPSSPDSWANTMAKWVRTGSVAENKLKRVETVNWKLFQGKNNADEKLVAIHCCWHFCFA